MSGPAKIIHVRDRGGFWTPWMPELYKCTHVPFVLQTLLHLDRDILECTYKSQRKWHSCLLWAAAFAIRSQCLFWWTDCAALISQHNLEPYSFLCDQQSNCWLSVWLLFPSVLFPVPSKTQYLTDMMFVTSTVYYHSLTCCYYYIWILHQCQQWGSLLTLWGGEHNHRVYAESLESHCQHSWSF